MCYMKANESGTSEQVGVRELRQNLSVYLARIARGETLEVTDRGHAVALLTPLPRETSVLDRLEREGLLTRATGDLLALKRPRMAVSTRGSDWLEETRADRL